MRLLRSYRVSAPPREIHSDYDDTSFSSVETNPNQSQRQSPRTESERSSSHHLSAQIQELEYSLPKSSSSEIGTKDQDEDMRDQGPRETVERSESPPLDYSSPLSYHSELDTNEGVEHEEIDGGRDEDDMDDLERCMPGRWATQSTPSPPIVGYLRDRPRRVNLWRVTQPASPPTTGDEAGKPSEGDKGCEVDEADNSDHSFPEYQQQESTERSDTVADFRSDNMEGKKQQLTKELAEQRKRALKYNPIIKDLLRKGQEEEAEEMLEVAEILIMISRGGNE